MSVRIWSLIVPAVVLTGCAAGAEAWQQPFFVISYWHGPPAEDTWYQQIADCNFNLVFCGDPDIAHKYGMKCLVSDSRIAGIKKPGEQVDAEIAQAVAELKDHPALFGYYLRDEPNASMFANLAHVNQLLLKLDPDHLPYINLYPDYASQEQLGTKTYEEHVERFCEVVRPQVLSYDHYALVGDGLRPSYFANMEVIRREALKYGIPFWYIFLATQHFAYRDPTEGELRWQAYTAIAYGAKGLLYFTYYWVNDELYGNALIRRDGTLDHKWYIAREMNAEFKALGPTLINLTSEKVYHTGGEPPQGASGPPPDAIVKSTGGAKLVIGELRDPEGALYIVVTNGRYDERVQADLVLDKRVKTVKEVSKRTGELHRCVLRPAEEGPTLRVRLGKGEGRVYALGF